MVRAILLFNLLVILGTSLSGMGVYYMCKEKDDWISVKTNRSVAVFGAVLVVGTVAVRVLL